MICRKCQSREAVKNGKVRGLQRYRGRGCGFNYTQEHGHGYPQEVKVLAVVLHLSGMTLNSIGAVIGVTAQSVMRWIKELAEQVPEPWRDGKTMMAHEVEMDEMHAFLLKKRKNSGSGKCWIMSPRGSWAGSAAITLWPPATG
jgi:transposase